MIEVSEAVALAHEALAVKYGALGNGLDGRLFRQTSRLEETMLTAEKTEWRVLFSCSLLGNRWRFYDEVRICPQTGACAGIWMRTPRFEQGD